MKRYTDAMNEVRFTPEEKQELSARLRQTAQSAPQHTHKPRRHRVRRAVCGALAAALAVTMLTAAAVPAFGDTLRAFFGMPVQSYPVGKSVTQQGWTFTVTDCLADSVTLYVALDVQAPEGTVVDPEDAPELNFDWEFFTSDHTPHNTFSSYKAEFVPEQYQGDNHLPFVITATMGSLEDDMTFDLTIWDIETSEKSLFRANNWATETYEPVQITRIPIEITSTIALADGSAVDIYGGTATLTDLSISPLAVTVRVEGGSCYNHGWVVPTHPEYLLPAARPLIAQGTLENTTCDCDFDLHLKYKDGRVVFIGPSYNDDYQPDKSIVSSWRAGTSCEDGIDAKTKQPNGKDTYVSTSVRFAVPQDLDQIESVIVCGKEYKLR